MKERKLENPGSHSLFTLSLLLSLFSFGAIYIITAVLLHLLHCYISSSTFLVSLYTSSPATELSSLQYQLPTEIWCKISQFPFYWREFD